MATKKGWHSTWNSRVNHYYVDGTSLCRRYMILCEPSNKTFHEKDCKACARKVAIEKGLTT